MAKSAKVLVVILILHLYGVKKEALGLSQLPELENNKLSEGDKRELPNATPINCTQNNIFLLVTVRKTYKVPEILTSANFAIYPFTAGLNVFPYSPRITGIEGKFSFAEIKEDEKTLYALQVDESGTKGYWLPQGGTIDIPRNPKNGEPMYVFTPDFYGSSLTVTPLKNGHLRLRHIEAGKEASQFNAKTPEEIGGNTTYAMEYKEYGYLVETDRLVSNVPAFAYMAMHEGNWTLFFQRKICSETLGTFSNHLMSRLVLFDYTLYPVKPYQPVSSAMALNIPHY